MDIFQYFLLYSNQDKFEPFVISLHSECNIGDFLSCLNSFSFSSRDVFINFVSFLNRFDQNTSILNLQIKFPRICDVFFVDLDNVEQIHNLDESALYTYCEKLNVIKNHFSKKFKKELNNIHSNETNFIQHHQFDLNKQTLMYLQKKEPALFEAVFDQRRIIEKKTKKCISFNDESSSNRHINIEVTTKKYGPEKIEPKKQQKNEAVNNVRIMRAEVINRLPNIFLFILTNLIKIAVILLLFSGYESIWKAMKIISIFIIFNLLKLVIPYLNFENLLNRLNQFFIYLGFIRNNQPDGNNNVQGTIFRRIINSILNVLRIVIGFVITLFPDFDFMHQQNQVVLLPEVIEIEDATNEEIVETNIEQENLRNDTIDEQINDTENLFTQENFDCQINQDIESITIKDTENMKLEINEPNKFEDDQNLNDSVAPNNVNEPNNELF